MNIIYRVQDKDGRGPWKPGFSHKWVKTRPDHDNLHPWPFEFNVNDILKNKNFNMACGCKTIEQLKRWFTEQEYKILKQYGYFAVKLKADKVFAESDIQCVFGCKKPIKKNVKKFKLY